MKKNEIIFNTLYTKYNKLMLTKNELCEELSISQATLNRRIKAHYSLPRYTVDGGKYLFPINSVASYLDAVTSL